MAITAPRYTPSGVNIGSMPVPKVEAQTGTADALRSIGESIGQMGKTAQYIADRRADAAETAGEDMFQKWQQDAQKRYADYGVKAHGTNIPDEKTALEGWLDGDDSSYTKDANPAVAEAFRKRKQFAAQGYKNKADTVALERTRSFTVETASKEQADAMESASYAEAGGKHEEYLFNMGRANAAAVRRAQITGEVHNYDDMQSAVLSKSLKHLYDQGAHDKVAKFYQQNDTNFGRYSDDAAALAAGSMNKIWGRDTAATLKATHTSPETGLTDWNAFYNQAPSEAEATPERLAILQQNAASMQIEENKRRTDVGQMALAQARQAARNGKGDVDVLRNSETFARMIQFAQPEQRESIMAAMTDSTKDTDLTQLRLWGKYGGRAEQDAFLAEATQAFSNRQLSHTHFEEVNRIADELRKSRGDDLDHRAARIVKKKWLDGGRAIPSATDKSDQKEQQAFMSEVQTLVNDVLANPAKDPKSDEDLEYVWALNKGSEIERQGNDFWKGLVGGQVEKINAREMYRQRFGDAPVQDGLAAVAGIRRDDLPVQRMMKIAAFEREMAMMSARAIEAQEEARATRVAAVEADPEGNARAFIESDPGMSRAQKDEMIRKNRAYYQQFEDRAAARRASLAP
jgi:hypothetical protein